MGTQYLMDTNAAIEFLGGALPASGSNWMQSIIDQNLHHLSVINQIELLGFNGSPTEMQTLEAALREHINFPWREPINAEAR